VEGPDVLYFDVPAPERPADARWEGVTMAYELVQVIASCGVHDDVAPNTLEAFEAAIRAGCDMTETDFRRCAEGVIVFHDAEAGGRPVAEMTRREIHRAAGVLPPTLDEFIECCRDRIRVDLELKEDGLEEAVLEALAPCFRPDQFLITSFYSTVLGRVRALSPEAPTGLLTIRGLPQYFAAHPEWADYRRPEEIFNEVRRLGANYLLPDYNDLDLLTAAGPAGIDTIAWGVDTEQHMRSVLAATHLRGIITSEPHLLRQVLHEAPV
jgi:glycerophosphoryl diester phosphodiesterase